MGWCLRVDRERDLRVAAGCSVPEIAIRRLFFFFFKIFFVAWISLALCLSKFVWVCVLAISAQTHKNPWWKVKTSLLPLPKRAHCRQRLELTQPLLLRLGAPGSGHIPAVLIRFLL